MDRSELTACLDALAEPKYAQFSSKLLPGVRGLKGVRLPALRQLAKRIAKENGADFQSVFAPRMSADTVPQESFEETMLRGLVLCCLKVPLKELFPLVADFVPMISNWSLCDSPAAGLKIFRKNPDASFEFLEGYLSSDREFYARFGAVMVLNHFADDDSLERSLKALECVRCGAYYAQMAVAWAYSVFYVRWPEAVQKSVLSPGISDAVLEMTVRKIRESRRISDSWKSRASAWLK